MSSTYKEGYIHVTGGDVWYKMEGEKGNAPLIVVHGGPGFPHDYLESLEDLQDEREVVFYDQLGCGKSDKSADINLWSANRFVSELIEIISFLSLKDYNILGQSWGSALAVSFALTKPTGLKSIILADPYISSEQWMKDAKRLKKTLPRKIQNVLKKHEDKGTTHSEEYLKASEIYNNNFVTRLNPLPEEFLRSRLGMNYEIYKLMWGSDECTITGTLKNFDLTTRLKEINLPVLLLCGRYDEASPESLRYYRALLPNSQMKIFKNSAHLPFLTERKEFISAAREFLKKVN